jgi:hypothetical protein
MQAKADGWLDRDALTQQLAQRRDGATHLLEQLNGGPQANAESPATAVQTNDLTRRPP